MTEPDTFLGAPLPAAKRLLRAWRYGSTRAIWPLAEQARLAPAHALAILDVAERLGLIAETDEPDARQPSLSPEGRGLAHASTARARARAPESARLEDIVTRASKLAARTDVPFEIGEIWLSGDLLDPTASRIGTTDLAITYEDRAGTPAAILDQYYAQAHRLALVAPAGRNPAETLPPLVRSAILYDGGRPGRVRETGIAALIARGIPCRCLYDRTRGGIVHDPLLPYHPDSPEAKQRPVLIPDGIAPPPYRVFDARLLNPRETVPDRYERFGPWPPDDPIYGVMRAQPATEALVLARADGKDGLSDNALTRRLRLRRCDGRARFVLALGHIDLRKPYPDRAIPPLRPEVGASIERRIVRHRTHTEYRLRVLTLDRLGTSRARTDAQAALLAWWIHIIASADRIGLLESPRTGREIHTTLRVRADAPLAESLTALIASTPGLGIPSAERPGDETPPAEIAPAMPA